MSKQKDNPFLPDLPEREAGKARKKCFYPLNGDKTGHKVAKRRKKGEPGPIFPEKFL